MRPELGAVGRRRLVRQGSVYTLASVLQAATAVLVLPIATRLLAPAEFGLVATATVVAQLLGLVAALGLQGSVMLEFFADRDDPGPARRLVGTAVVAAAAVVALVDLTLPLWSSGFAELDDTTALRLALWTAVPLAVLASGQALLRSQGRPGAYVAATACATVGGHGLGALLVALGGGGARTYLLGLLLGATTGAAVALLAGGVARPRRGDGRLVRRALTVGLPLVPHTVAMFALLAADRIVIERTLGLDAAGRYQIAYLIGAGGLSLLAAVNNAWSPMILGAEADVRWSTLAASTREIERLVPYLVGTVALGAPLALLVAAPAGYDPAALADLTAVVAASALPFVWYLSGVHVVLFRRRTGIMALTTPTVAAVAVGANLVLLPVVGLMGAAVVTVGSYLLLAALVRRAAGRLEAVAWDRAASGRAALAVGVAVTVAVLVPATGAWVGGRAVLAVGVGALGLRSLVVGERMPTTVTNRLADPSAAVTG